MGVKKRRGGKIAYIRNDGTSKLDSEGAPRYTTPDKTVEEIGKTTIITGYNTDRENVDSILAVTAYNEGIIDLDYNRNRIQSEKIGGSRHYPVMQHTIDGAYVITSKAYNEKAEHAGINWGNVEVVTGRTYGIGSLIKPMGFEWNRDYRVWARKEHPINYANKLTASQAMKSSDQKELAKIAQGKYITADYAGTTLGSRINDSRKINFESLSINQLRAFIASGGSKRYIEKPEAADKFVSRWS